MEPLHVLPWAAMPILLPLAGAITVFLWPKSGTVVSLATISAIAVAVTKLALFVSAQGTFRHAVGGWEVPLGITLYADGLSIAMLIMSTLVALGITLYSTRYYAPEASEKFWPLWLLTLAGLNALFLSADLFNLYVTLELTGLGAVSLAALTAKKEALVGATRYLLAALLGSMTYLLGVALLYHGFGTLDLFAMMPETNPSAFVWAALGLISAGLMLKSALFPLHFWLPSAHSSASAPVSALLSALVVKAAFYVLMRIWIDGFSGMDLTALLPLLSVAGIAAVLWGSLLALMQHRLKLMIAYSTVAQLGYLMLALSFALRDQPAAFEALICLALSHAFAKSAMFLVAGNMIRFNGHDNIRELKQTALRLPVSATAFALAGVSIIGLPPSGGFTGKWLLLEAGLALGRWEVAVAVIAGGLLAAAYIFKVLGFAFTKKVLPELSRPVPAVMEWSALLLAFAAIAVGMMPSLLPDLFDTSSLMYAGRLAP